MKTKIFGLALMLSLATMLGACAGGGQEPAGTTTPAAGEPADNGGATPAATTAPEATPATTEATPTATPTTTP